MPTVTTWVKPQIAAERPSECVNNARRHSSTGRNLSSFCKEDVFRKALDRPGHPAELAAALT